MSESTQPGREAIQSNSATTPASPAGGQGGDIPTLAGDALRHDAAARGKSAIDEAPKLNPSTWLSTSLESSPLPL